MIKSMEALNECFREARHLHQNFVGVAVRIHGISGFELIINTQLNYDEKQRYYNNTYDNCLDHKHAEGISIIGYAYGDTLDEIGEVLNKELEPLDAEFYFTI